MPGRSTLPARSNRPAFPPAFRWRSPAVVAALAAALVAGCAVAATASPGSTATSPSAAATMAATTAVTPMSTPTAGTSPAPSPSLPSQTDTAWGRIWDALPAGFPRYPGAAEASVGRGPASAELTVAADPAAVVTALQTALEGAGYRTVTVSGPMEDGSRTIESEGTTPGCRVQTTVGPLGGLTAITVLFGAACPFR